MSYSWELTGNRTYVDGDHTVAQPVSLPERSCPIPTVNIEYQLEQDFQQDSASWAPLALNTPHPDFSSFLLAAEGPRKDLGGGLVKWKRTYIYPPAQHFTPESFGYNFIGYSGAIYTTSTAFASYGVVNTGFIIQGRQRFARVVTSKIQNDYFAVGTGMTYADGFAIPTILGQRYYATSVTTTGLFTDFLYNAIGSYSASVPSMSGYQGWVADAVANGWAAVSGGVMVAEDSKLTPWMGNIYVRKTRYILAL
jgi:hypothetical protein